MGSNLPWIWAFLAALVSTSYFFLIKQLTIRKSWILLSIIILLELLVIWLYYESLKNTGSGLMYALINGLSVIMGILIALTFFHEQLSLKVVLGIIIIIAGILVAGGKRVQAHNPM